VAKPRKPPQKPASEIEPAEPSALGSGSAPSGREQQPALPSPMGDDPGERSAQDYSRVAFTPDDPVERPTDQAQIRARAYELYVERGTTQGNDVEDWLRAEREVRARNMSPHRDGGEPEATA
jgi:hypothetical protein